MVRNHPIPPTPLQPPTGSPRQSSRFAATPHRQRPCSPRRACPVGAKGSRLNRANNAHTAPDGFAVRGVASEPLLQTGQARLGARVSFCRGLAFKPCAPVGQADWGRTLVITAGSVLSGGAAAGGSRSRGRGQSKTVSQLLEERSGVGTELIVLTMAVGQMRLSFPLFQGRCPWLC
jgi:hypothetical protein